MKKSSVVITIVIVVAICATIVAWQYFRPPDERAQLADKIAVNVRAILDDAFKAVLTPTVRIDQRVIIQQNTPTLELATASRNVAAEYTYDNTWAGSRKIIVLQGTFVAKAGFDLSKKTSLAVDVDSKTMRMVAELPEPKLLSLEQTDYKVVRDEGGWWNPLSPKERENAFKGLQEVARQEVEKSGILADAKAAVGAAMTKSLRDSKASDVEIKFH